MSGKGKYYYSDGSFYIGEYRGNMPYGQGSVGNQFIKIEGKFNGEEVNGVKSTDITGSTSSFVKGTILLGRTLDRYLIRDLSDIVISYLVN